MSPDKPLYTWLGRANVWAVLLTVAITLVSCVEWTTNGAGQLESLGLPGVPLWKSQTLSQQQALARRGSLAAPPGAVTDPAAAQIAAYSSDAEWLAAINRWRVETRTTPIGQNPSLSDGAAKHAEYLVKNGPQDEMAFSQYAEASGGAAHTEQPGNPFFTQEGYDAARLGAGDVAWSECNATQFVDGWVHVPFHRLSILAPWVRVGGYGDYGTCPVSAAALTLRGSTSVGLTQAVMFPPDGASVTGKLDRGEWPDPLDGCSGYSYPSGTPITLQLGAFVKVHLASYQIDDETSGHEVETCGFDSMTYPTEHGRQLLTDYGAVVVVPRHPLLSGHTYRVTINTQRHREIWSFGVIGKGSPSARVEKSHPLSIRSGSTLALTRNSE